MTSRRRLQFSTSRHLEVSPFVSLYSRQAGVSSFWCHRLERPACPRRIFAVTHSFQTTPQYLSVFPFLPRHYHMTRVLLLPFITTVWIPVVREINNIIYAALKMLMMMMMMMMMMMKVCFRFVLFGWRSAAQEPRNRQKWSSFVDWWATTVSQGLLLDLQERSRRLTHGKLSG